MHNPEDLAATIALQRRQLASAEARLANVEAACACVNGERHYYAVDATCQRCEMPSWVEALFRAALAPAPTESA